MIEYKAYHKKSLGKRKRPHAARRKKKKGKEETPGRTQFRRSIPIIPAGRAFLLLGAAAAGGMLNCAALYYVEERGSIFKRLTAYDAKNLPILTGFSRGDLAAKDPVTIRNLKKTIDLLHPARAARPGRHHPA